MFLLIQPDAYTQTYGPPLAPVVQHPTLWHHMTEALQLSLYRVASLLISLLPGLLAFFLALALLAGIGLLMSWIVQRILVAAKFDERMSRNNGNAIVDWSPGHSPTRLIGRLLFWGCVLLGLAIGISAFDASYETGSLLSFALLPYLSRFVGAILLLVAGNLIARFLARTVLIGAVNNQLQYARFLSMGVKWLVIVLTAAMALDHLQIGGGVVELAFGIVFGGIVLTLALAIGLGSRDLVTRSLERTTEKTERPPSTPPARPEATETLRHF
jgi:hypothetical protein